MNTFATALAATAALACHAGSPAAAGRTPPSQNARRMPEVPLDFDPANPEPVDGWWTNGSELLRLEPNGAYRMWASQDRFKRPVEVGAWRRSNYVFFDLEPYRAKPGTRHRVDLQKDAGVTELRRDGMTDFRRVAAPPRVLADEMLGAWISPNEELLVLDNGRYEWRRTGQAQGITEISGAWNTDGDVLMLAPDTPAVDLTNLRCVKGPDGQWTLEGHAGRLTRPPLVPLPGGAAAPAATAPAAAPAATGPAGAAPSGSAPAPKASGAPAPPKA